MSWPFAAPSRFATCLKQTNAQLLELEISAQKALLAKVRRLLPTTLPRTVLPPNCGPQLVLRCGFARLGYPPALSCATSAELYCAQIFRH